MPLLHAVAAYNGKTRLRTCFAIDHELERRLRAVSRVKEGSSQKTEKIVR